MTAVLEHPVDLYPGCHAEPVTHDLPCQGCGHAAHRYLPCSPSCACQPPPAPGSLPLAC